MEVVRRSKTSEHLEIRPCGMLVQRRNSDANTAPTPRKPTSPTIKVKVKHAASYLDVHISSQASFGELKKKLAAVTGLRAEDQRLIFREKERDSRAFLDVARVRDGAKMALLEDEASRERRCVEKRRSATAALAAKALAENSMEVDKLQGQIKALESVACRGGKVSGFDADNLIEMLMSRLIVFDGIVAEGDLKTQRRLQVRRVQKLIETLDALKLQIAKPRRAIDRKVRDHRRESPIAENPGFQRSLVTTKWETFD